DGSIDYVSVFRELPFYAGWVVVEAEQDPAKANPLRYATTGFNNLVGFLAEAGLAR
ncbi:MAG: myo-inosose-2 dehydratase, partial [Gluconacetobacter diazotrophicus]|nr:myo-inosose-2 dehydratase [Gluconacetobacter diazotrophicus]